MRFREFVDWSDLEDSDNNDKHDLMEDESDDYDYVAVVQPLPSRLESPAAEIFEPSLYLS